MQTKRPSADMPCRQQKCPPVDKQLQYFLPVLSLSLCNLVVLVLDSRSLLASVVLVLQSIASLTAAPSILLINL